MDLAKDKIMEGDCRTVTVKSDFYRECGTFTKCFHKKIAALITAVNTMAVTSIHLKVILLNMILFVIQCICYIFIVQGIPLSEIGDDGVLFTHRNGSHSDVGLNAFLDLLRVMRDQDCPRMRFIGLTDENLHDSDCVLIADALSTMAKIAPVNAASPEIMLIERSKTGLSSEVVLLLQSTCADAGIELELDSGRSVQ
jgi:hypothetical protein